MGTNPIINLKGTQELLIKSVVVLGGFKSLLTLKASSRDKVFPHTYKVTTSLFHSRYGI